MKIYGRRFFEYRDQEDGEGEAPRGVRVSAAHLVERVEWNHHEAAVIQHRNPNLGKGLCIKENQPHLFNSSEPTFDTFGKCTAPFPWY